MSQLHTEQAPPQAPKAKPKLRDAAAGAAGMARPGARRAPGRQQRRPTRANSSDDCIDDEYFVDGSETPSPDHGGADSMICGPNGNGTNGHGFQRNGNGAGKRRRLDVSGKAAPAPPRFE